MSKLQFSKTATHIIPRTTRLELERQISEATLYEAPQPQIRAPDHKLDQVNLQKKSVKEKVDIITKFLENSKDRHKEYKRKLRKEKFSLATQQFRELQKNMRTSEAKHNKIFLSQQRNLGRYLMTPQFLPVLDKDEDVRPEVVERERAQKEFLRSQPKWQYLSKFGKVFDGNKLYQKTGKKPHIDKYFYQTMAEIRANLVFRNPYQQNKPKNWRGAVKPQTKFSHPHPNKYHFYKAGDKEMKLQEDAFRITKRNGNFFSRTQGSII